METLQEQRCFVGLMGRYRHDSSACGPMEIAVFVPPGAPGQRFPALYFLSGLTCTTENFTAKAGAQRVAAELGLILVIPDTSPRGAGVPGEDDDWDLGTGAGFYVDATQAPWSERYRMYTYITRELPAFIDANFPTRGEGGRSISGHSMGGHGALVIGLREPERWRSVSAFAPICAPSEVPWGHKAFGAYLGPSRDAWAAYDATELVGRQRHPHPIRIDQGGADGFLDSQLRPDRFAEAARRAGQPLQLRMREGYDHSYFFIATFIEEHVRFHGHALG